MPQATLARSYHTRPIITVKILTHSPPSRRAQPLVCLRTTGHGWICTLTRCNSSPRRSLDCRLLTTHRILHDIHRSLQSREISSDDYELLYALHKLDNKPRTLGHDEIARLGSHLATSVVVLRGVHGRDRGGRRRASPALRGGSRVPRRLHRRVAHMQRCPVPRRSAGALSALGQICVYLLAN